MQKLTGTEKLNLALPEDIQIPDTDLEIFKIIPHPREMAEYVATISAESPEITESDAVCMKKAQIIEKYLNRTFKHKHMKIAIRFIQTLLREKHKDDDGKEIWHNSVKVFFSIHLLDTFDEHDTEVKTLSDIAHQPEIHPGPRQNQNLKKNLARIKNIIHTKKLMKENIQKPVATEQQQPQQNIQQNIHIDPQHTQQYHITDNKKILLKQLEDRIAARLEKRILEDLEKKIIDNFNKRANNIIESKMKQKNALKREDLSKFHLFT